MSTPSMAGLMGWDPAVWSGGSGLSTSDPYAAIKTAYRRYLGREATPQDLAAHTGNGQAIKPQNINAAVLTIQGSPEAKTYAAAHPTYFGGAGGVSATDPDTTTPPGTTPPATTANATPWTDPASSTRAPRIVTRNGQTFLQEHGDERLLQPGQEQTDGAKYVADFWAKYPTGFIPGSGPQTNAAYTPALTGTGGAGGGGYAYTGFDFNQAASNRDTGKSAKYAFADATTQAAAQGAGNLWETKAGAQQFAEQYVKPYMEARGYTVYEIIGDKMRIGTRENPAGEWIDFVVNAGGDNPALAWQAQQSKASAFAGDAYAPGGVAPTATTTPPPTTPTPGDSGITPPVNTAYDMAPNAYRKLIDPLADLALY